MHTADIILTDNICFVTGDIHFSNVMSVYEKGLTFFNNQVELTFDFSQVTSSDSSAVALIVEWLNAAKSKQKNIFFKVIPERLLAIIQAARMEHLLNINLIQ